MSFRYYLYLYEGLDNYFGYLEYLVSNDKQWDGSITGLMGRLKHYDPKAEPVAKQLVNSFLELKK